MGGLAWTVSVVLWTVDQWTDGLMEPTTSNGMPRMEDDRRSVLVGLFQAFMDGTKTENAKCSWRERGEKEK